MTEASSGEGENWRSSEQEDVTECQYQVSKVARKKGRGEDQVADEGEKCSTSDDS